MFFLLVFDNEGRIIFLVIFFVCVCLRVPFFSHPTGLCSGRHVQRAISVVCAMRRQIIVCWFLIVAASGPLRSLSVLHVAVSKPFVFFCLGGMGVLFAGFFFFLPRSSSAVDSCRRPAVYLVSSSTSHDSSVIIVCSSPVPTCQGRKEMVKKKSSMRDNISMEI